MRSGMLSLRAITFFLISAICWLKNFLAETGEPTGVLKSRKPSINSTGVVVP